MVVAAYHLSAMCNYLNGGAFRKSYILPVAQKAVHWCAESALYGATDPGLSNITLGVSLPA